MKKGSTDAQARRLLILFEILSGDEVALPAPNEEPEFFPGSWTNWRRKPLPDATVHSEEGVEEHDATARTSTTLLLAQIKRVEKVCEAPFSSVSPQVCSLCAVSFAWPSLQAYAALDFGKQKNLTTFAMAVKFANANLTPTQKRQSDQAIIDAKREKQALADAKKKKAAEKREQKQAEEEARQAALLADKPPQNERVEERVCGPANPNPNAFDDDDEWTPVNNDNNNVINEDDGDAGDGRTTEGTPATGDVANSRLQPSAAQLSPRDRCCPPNSRADSRAASCPNGPNATPSGVAGGQGTPGSNAGFGYALDGGNMANGCIAGHGMMNVLQGSGTESVAQRGEVPMRGALGYVEGRGWMNERCAHHMGSPGIGYMGGGNVCIGAGIGSCNVMGARGVQMMSGGVNSCSSGYQVHQYPTYPQLLQPQPPPPQQQLWAHTQPPMPDAATKRYRTASHYRNEKDIRELAGGTSDATYYRKANAVCPVAI